MKEATKKEMKRSLLFLLLTFLAFLTITLVARYACSQTLEERFGDEYSVIVEAAKANGCVSKEDMALLFAIRKAENGPAGTEFGVLNPKAKGKGLRTQAGWTAASITKNRQRFKGGEDFVDFMSRRWCPVGAANDPTGLNKNWSRNVKFWFKKLKEAT